MNLEASPVFFADETFGDMILRAHNRKLVHGARDRRKDAVRCPCREGGMRWELANGECIGEDGEGEMWLFHVASLGITPGQ